MYKSELAELARYGVRQKLAEMQQYLAKMFRDFPEEFAATTAPVFLRADEKRNGNSWPAFTLTESNGDTPSKKREWSPEARAAAGARIRKTMQQNSLRAEWGSLLWHQVQDDLLAQPERSSRLNDVSKRLKRLPSSVRSAVMTHQKMFRIRGGVVTLIKPVKHLTQKPSPSASKRTHHAHGGKRQPAHKWGAMAWQKMHDFLAGQPEQTASIQAIMKALRITVQPTIISAVKLHSDVLTRSGPGTYRLVRELTPEEKQVWASGAPRTTPPADA